MSLLDDIHQKANAKRSEIDSAEKRAEHFEHIYLTTINPALKKTYSYLNELVNELNFIDDPVVCSYKIPGLEEPQENFYHGKYSIATNSSERMTEIRISFICLRDKPIHFLIENDKRANAISDELFSFQVGYDQRPVYDNRNRKIGTYFDLTGQIAVQVRVFVVPGSAKLKIESHNFPSLGHFDKTIEPDQLGNLAEQIGLFILRRDNSIMTFDLPSETRADIQHRLKQDNARQQREEIKARLNNPNAVQENKAPKPGFFRRLFSRNKL
jgi:hypothetical protein